MTFYLLVKGFYFFLLDLHSLYSISYWGIYLTVRYSRLWYILNILHSNSEKETGPLVSWVDPEVSLNVLKQRFELLEVKGRARFKESIQSINLSFFERVYLHELLQLFNRNLNAEVGYNIH